MRTKDGKGGKIPEMVFGRRGFTKSDGEDARILRGV